MLKIAESNPLLTQYNNCIRYLWKCQDTFMVNVGGSGEIRTHGPISEPSVFKTGAINRTLPRFLIWCPRRDSNPQDLVSKTNMYTNSITWAIIYFWYPHSDSNWENFSFWERWLYQFVHEGMVPDIGIEPMTYRLSSDYSTAELIRCKFWCRLSGSNQLPRCFKPVQWPHLLKRRWYLQQDSNLHEPIICCLRDINPPFYP